MAYWTIEEDRISKNQIAERLTGYIRRTMHQGPDSATMRNIVKNTGKNTPKGSPTIAKNTFSVLLEDVAGVAAREDRSAYRIVSHRAASRTAAPCLYTVRYKENELAGMIVWLSDATVTPIA